MKMEIEGSHLLDFADAIKSTGNNPLEALIKLKEDGWLVMSAGPADVIMAAVKVPKQAMDTYAPGSYNQIGVNVNKLEGFVNDKEDIIEMWMEDRALHLDDGNTHVRMATVVPEHVSGNIPSPPDVEYEVEVVADPEFITDFTKRANDVISSEHYYVGCREDGLYLYADADNGTIDKHYGWDWFESYDIDWSINNTSDTENEHIPKDDHAVDALFGSGFTEDLKFIEDTATINIANQHPMRFVFDTGEEDQMGMKVSYIQTPRFDKSGSSIVPDHIIEG